jgi:16S rRNA (uracil1498-N3)-methyltransferase
VGPEGGFTDAEVRAAQDAGWQTVGLGPRILRIETAALVLATLATI